MTDTPRIETCDRCFHTLAEQDGVFWCANAQCPYWNMNLAERYPRDPKWATGIAWHCYSCEESGATVSARGGITAHRVRQPNCPGTPVLVPVRPHATESPSAGFHFTEPRRCVECEGCGFAFDAAHHDDTATRGYSCPVCAA